mgnify:CR=1 FL=1
MAKRFLQIDKDLFGYGLTPVELLVYAQVSEFNRNTGDCFISDKAMAEAFGVSESTISRAVENLENKGCITKTTKNTDKGKERHMKDNPIPTIKMTVGEEQPSINLTLGQQSNCLLANKQNDFIKDNSEKENKEEEVIENPSLRSGVLNNFYDLPAGKSKRELEEEFKRIF